MRDWAESQQLELAQIKLLPTSDRRSICFAWAGILTTVVWVAAIFVWIELMIEKYCC